MSTVQHEHAWTTDDSSNPFARLLRVYELYKRSNLTSSGLEKIAKKYKSKPDLLLQDVSKKYPSFSIPASVPIVEIARLIQVYAVPEVYRLSLGEDVNEKIASCSIIYDSALDIRSDAFDPLRSLLERRVFAPMLNVPRLDNVNKAKALLPSTTGEIKTLDQVKAEAALALQSRSEARAGGGSHVSSAQEPRRPIVAQISTDSSRERLPNGTELETPLALLLTFMNAREKVTIVIRGRNSIRGFIHGFIRGFDKHFNIALTDADEERLQPRSSDEVESSSTCNDGQSTSIVHRPSILSRRHFPQVLLRGDNIVSIYRFNKKSFEISV